jgi:hypothetical protein
MSVSGRGFYDWSIAKKREEARRLEKEATKLLAKDRAANRRRETVVKPKTAESESLPRGSWINLGELRAALRKKGGICVR